MTENNIGNRIAHVEKFLVAAAAKLGTAFTPATGSNEFRLAAAQEFIRTTAAKYGVKVEEIDVVDAADTIEGFLAEKAKDVQAPYTTFAAALEAEKAAEEAAAAAAKAAEVPVEVDLSGLVQGLAAQVQKLVDFAKRYGFGG